MIRLVTRKLRQIVGFDVAYDKSENRMQKIVDSSIKAKCRFDTIFALSLIWHFPKTKVSLLQKQLKNCKMLLAKAIT